MKQMTKEEKYQRDRIVHQMMALWIIFTSGNKDIKTSLRKLKMDNKECHQIARECRIDWIADEIEKFVKI